MAVHSFWDAEFVDHKDRKLKVKVHAVGLDPTDPDGIIDHLQRHGHRHKEIKLTPMNGLVNLHGYPVIGPRGPDTPIHSIHNDSGDRVDMQTGQILGPDGEPIEIDEEDLAVPPIHPNPSVQKAS